VVALWIAVGLDWAVHLLRPHGASPFLRRMLVTVRVLLFAAAACLPVLIAARHLPDLDVSQRWAVHDFGQQVLEQPLPSNSTIVGLLGEMTLLRYLQETQGLRPDVKTIVADDESERLAAVESALAMGRTV